MISKKTLTLCLIIFLLSFGIRIFFIFQKQGFFIDEIYTRTTIVGKFEAVNNLCNQYSKMFSSKWIKNWIFGKPENSTLTDLKQIWLNNYNDSAHPNLYFFLMRIGLNTSDFSPQGFINFGCGVNLIFFTFSFFIMMKILIRLFGDNKLVPIGLAIAFLNTGTISMTLFIRPYEMQILGFVFISYIYLIYEDKLKLNENIFNLKDITILLSSLSFICLISYFLVLYAIILGIPLLYYARKNKKNILTLFGISLITVPVILIFFPGYFQCIHDERFSDVSYNYKNLINFIPRIINSMNIFISFIFYKIILFVSFIALIFYQDKNNKINKQCFRLFLLSLIWVITICLITSYMLIRYFTPCFPVLSLAIIILIEKIRKDKQAMFSLIFLILYLITSIFPYKQEFGYNKAYENQKAFVLPFGTKIENLWDYDTPYIKENVPIYIFLSASLEPLNIFSKFDDTHDLIIINDNIENLDKIRDNEFYLINTNNFDYNPYYYNVKALGKIIIFKIFYIRRTSVGN